LFGAAAFILGGLFMICWPRLARELETPELDDPPPGSAKAIHNTRWAGVLLLALGLLVLYFTLFGEPATDPTLF
jgi:hypothetical protein